MSVFSRPRLSLDTPDLVEAVHDRSHACAPAVVTSMTSVGPMKFGGPTKTHNKPFHLTPAFAGRGGSLDKVERVHTRLAFLLRVSRPSALPRGGVTASR